MENSERQRMAAIKDMERNPSPMTKAFLRPAYDGTEACPIYCRRPSKANMYLKITSSLYLLNLIKYIIKLWLLRPQDWTKLPGLVIVNP